LKEEGSFHVNKTTKSGLHSWCKECVSQKDKGLYSKDITKYRELKIKSNQKQRDKKRKLIFYLLSKLHISPLS